MKIDVSTINDVFTLATSSTSKAAMRYKHSGAWKTYTTEDLYRAVRNLSRGFAEWGLQKGDRVALISENRPEWAVADFACLSRGLVDVPIYPTLTAEQTAYIVGDSGARVAIVSTQAQLQKMLPVLARTKVERVLVMDEVDDPAAMRLSLLTESAPHERDPRFEQMAKGLRPDDLASIIYTSGTTGTPKGVMLTHGNIASNLRGTSETFTWSRGEGYVSFLPLSHITARHVDYVMFSCGIGVTYCPDFNDLPQLLREVRPHNFVSVPRVYEKVRQEAERRGHAGVKRVLYDWALRTGRRHRQEVLEGKLPDSIAWNIADALVFRKIRQGLGGRAEVCISGGAPLSLDVAQWFADVGIRICEGYGLTETSPVIAVNSSSAYKIGTVGRPVPNIECRIAPDGELLVRGPSVTKGYWNLPQETHEAFEGGWFKTGDIANIDEDGFLAITDRKKDLIKTSGGKFIAPQPVENALKANVLVAHAALIGDRRKFPAVLIAPHFPLLEDWAHANGLAFTAREDLIHNEKIRALYEGIVADLNGRLAQYERMKRVLLVPDEFTVATGEITPSLKLKRRAVEAKYAALIDEMYAHAEAEHASETASH